MLPATLGADVITIGRVALAALLVAVASCSKRDPADHPRAQASSRDTISLDSCARLDARATPQNHVLEPGETIPPANPGSWTLTKRVTLDSFQLDLPATASVRPGHESGAYVISDLPGCRYACAIDVAWVRDTAERSLDGYVASLRADTSNSEYPGMDIDWIR